MKIRFLSALSFGMIGVAGCNMFGSSDSSKSYPTTPPAISTTAMSPTTVATTMPTVLKVPADATELSSGDYPPPAFAVPNQAGTIMVVDLDGDPTVAVASTTVSAKDFGSKMSITDVPNMTISMNKLHKYRIVFVPNKGTTP
jgi:hypothetical protein